MKTPINVNSFCDYFSLIRPFFEKDSVAEHRRYILPYMYRNVNILVKIY